MKISLTKPLFESVSFSFWQDGKRHHHVFKTGWGPCGRWVSALSTDFKDGLLVIEQRSYSIDQSVTFGELKVFAAHAGVGHVKAVEQVIARRQIRELNEIVREDRKIESFVYQLSDIFSPIKRVHLDNKKWGVKNPH